jgi:flagellin-specific chaperone FliS
MQRKHIAITPGRRGRPAKGGACLRDGSAFAATGAAGVYLATDRAGATPRRLRMLLYDGAIRLCRQGLSALDDGQTALAADRLARAGGIVERLRRDLFGEGQSERLAHFARLYDQVARRLVEADFFRRREPVKETIDLLNRSREHWGAWARSLDDTTEAADADLASWVG